MDWLIFAIIGGFAILAGYKVIKWQPGREVQVLSVVIGIFLLGMGTTDLMDRLNQHDGLGGKLGEEPEVVRVSFMSEEQICFFLLHSREEGCAPRSDLIGLDRALQTTSFVGPTFEVVRVEENGVYRGIEILDPRVKH